jgi:hypothetical protein
MAMKDAKQKRMIISFRSESWKSINDNSQNYYLNPCMSPCVWRRAMMQHQKKHLLWAK